MAPVKGRIQCDSGCLFLQKLRCAPGSLLQSSPAWAAACWLLFLLCPSYPHNITQRAAVHANECWFRIRELMLWPKLGHKNCYGVPSAKQNKQKKKTTLCSSHLTWNAHKRWWECNWLNDSHLIYFLVTIHTLSIKAATRTLTIMSQQHVNSNQSSVFTCWALSCARWFPDSDLSSPQLMCTDRDRVVLAKLTMLKYVHVLLCATQCESVNAQSCVCGAGIFFDQQSGWAGPSPALPG